MMTVTNDRSLIPSPEVVFTELQNGEAVLLHMQTLDYYTLNRTGVEVWSALQEGETPRAAAQRLTVHYEVSLADAEATVMALTAQLIEEKLVTVGAL